MGGALEIGTTGADLEAEVDRLTPFVEEGGYIPTCDHNVPPDVSLVNYRHFLDLAGKRGMF